LWGKEQSTDAFCLEFVSQSWGGPLGLLPRAGQLLVVGEDMWGRICGGGYTGPSTQSIGQAGSFPASSKLLVSPRSLLTFVTAGQAVAALAPSRGREYLRGEKPGWPGCPRQAGEDAGCWEWARGCRLLFLSVDFA
jgi:hypothetical protein